MKGLAAYGLVTLIAVVFDQGIKRLVENGLEMQQKVDLLPFLALYRTYNTGVAFSMFSSIGDRGLVIMSLLVSGFVLYLATRTEPSQAFARTGFALIIGGALGNLIDRSVYGYVIDYILFYTPVWSFAIFNLADVFITIGAGLVILEEVLAWRRERSRAAGHDAD